MGRAKGSVASSTDLNEADLELGRIRFLGQEASSLRVGAFISAFTSGVWTGASYPSYITFSTTAASSTSPAERMRIDKDGNVGIGNSGTFDNPNSIDKVLEIATASPVGLILNDTRDANPFCIENRGAVLHIAHGTTSRLMIDDSGNVGIGLTNPSDYNEFGHKLVVKDSTNAGISIISDTDGDGSLYFGDGTGAATYRGWLGYNHANDSMSVGTAATERIRITNLGNVGS